MNLNELAQKMLNWELKDREIKVLETEIEADVLEHGESVTIGLVRATYSKGRRELDYKSPVLAVEDDPVVDALIEKYTTTIEGHWVPGETKIDWAAVAKEHGLEPDVVSQAPPSVKLKILEPKK